MGSAHLQPLAPCKASFEVRVTHRTQADAIQGVRYKIKRRVAMRWDLRRDAMTLICWLGPGLQEHNSLNISVLPAFLLEQNFHVLGFREPYSTLLDTLLRRPLQYEKIGCVDRHCIAQRN